MAAIVAPSEGVGLGRLKLVVISDQAADAGIIAGRLGDAALASDLTHATGRIQLRAALRRGDIDAVLWSQRSRELRIEDALKVVAAYDPGVPLLVLDGEMNDGEAAEYVRLGAVDFVVESDVDRLPHAIANAVTHARVERSARDAEKSYQALFLNLPVAVFRATAEGRILHANPAAVELFGFPDLKTLLATSAFDLFVHPDERRELLTRLQADGSLIDFESLMRRADGSEFWFSRVVHVVREGDGRAIVWETIGRDATERFEAVRRLQESEAHLREIIETAPDAVVRMDDSGNITGWNSAAVETFGWTSGEVLGRNVSETIVPPELREGRARGLARFHRDGSSTLVGRRWDTFEGLRKDGGIFPMELALSNPIALGGTSQFVAFARDLSSQKEAEVTLAASEERLRSLLAGTPVAVVSLDTEGRFTFAGGSVFAQMGLDPSSLVGLRLAEAFSERPDFLALWSRGLEDEYQVDLEVGGRTYHVRCGPLRMDPRGDVIGVRALALDITDRVEADRASRESAEIFRLLFEQSTVGISLYEIPRDGRAAALSWNSRMREMLGREPGPGDAWRNWYSEGAQAEIEAKFGLLLSGALAELRERRLWTRPDGTEVWLDWSAVLLRDPEGQPLRFQTIALDVTDQVVAEQQLARRAAQQKVLLELSRAGLEGRETADFLAAAAEMLARGTSTQYASILELRHSNNTLIRAAAYGHEHGGSLDPTTFDVSFLAVEALKSEMPVLTTDYSNESTVKRSPWMIEGGVLASMVVGVRGRDLPFGVVAVHSKVASEFSADDIQFMQLASNIISVAVERKREEQQRKLLLGHLVTAQEAERKAIAEDIHDDAVQVMTAANLRLELVRMSLTDPVQLEAARKLQETISLSIGRLRNLLFELIPPDLERHGLAAAFRRQLEQFATDTGVTWELQVESAEEPSPQVRILLYRIFQEAMVNVRKHARATSVSVSLAAADGGVILQVSDDGTGFVESPSEPLAGHLGLASMRERAEIAGGWCRLTSQPGEGTRVSAWVPASRSS